jgi:hypothetical protein
MSVETEIFIHVGDGKRSTSWLQNLTLLICQELVGLRSVTFKIIFYVLGSILTEIQDV